MTLLSGYIIITVFLFFPLILSINEICDGTRFVCPTGDTCCKLGNETYGCCPMPNAICCSDHEHCCPHSTVCDGGRCYSDNGKSISGIKVKLALLDNKVKETKNLGESIDTITCKDGRTHCRDSATCCLLGAQKYGCCPLPNAVCCDDHKHCCPHNTACKGGKCYKENGKNISAFKVKVSLLNNEVETKKVDENVLNRTCGDRRTQCRDSDTCCLLGAQKYGCCPLPNAVCCDDHEHCCPHNTVCDGGRCFSDNGKSISGFKVKLALLNNEVETKKVDENIQDRTCGDGKTQCHDSDTCCLMDTQKYGCCPLPNAVCCSDHKSCCPEGTVCDLGMCIEKDKVAVPGFTYNLSVSIEKEPSKLYKYTSNNMCEDKKTECPDEATCCLLNSGEYGCCPIENAVCCNDHLHCCPYHFKCNLKEESCDDESTGKRISLIKKIAGRKLPTKDNRDVENLCPGNKYECPSDYSCCREANGSYNCCPSTQKCNILTGKCVNKGFLRGASKNKKVKAKRINLNDAVNLKIGFTKCFGYDYCKKMEVCCRGFDGFNFCCPKSQGLCDPSGYGCYESGYTYDEKTRKAVLKTEIGEFYSPLTKSTLALKKTLNDSVVCGDGTICEDNQSCCPYEDDTEYLQYRCCPFKNGECCRNSCCAPGHMCYMNGKCLKK